MPLIARNAALLVAGLIALLPCVASARSPLRTPPLTAREITTDGLKLGGPVTCEGDGCELTGMSALAPGAGAPRALSDWLKATTFTVPSLAALRSWPIAPLTDGALLRTNGYYAAGDQGGATYAWSAASTATDDGCAVIRPSAVASGSAGRWLYATKGSVISVRQCGAKGDGTTDDTAAIQAAINWAESTRQGNSYWSSTELGSVYLAPGFYTSSGNDIHRQIRFYGDAPGSVTITLRGGANRSLLRSYALPLTDSDAGPGYGQSLFENFTISGYGTGQDAGATSHGIELPQASYDGTVRYGAGGRFKNLVITGVKSSGIFIAGNRNLNFIDGVIINYAQQAGIYIAGGADHHISNSSIGANANGVTFYSCSAGSIVNSAIYNNTGDGVQVTGSSGSYFFVTGTTVGANGQHGVNVTSDNGGRDLVVGLSNVHITDNSQTTDNTYSNIYLRNFTQVMLDGVWLNNSNGATPKQGKYLIDNDTSGLVYANGLTYATSGAAVAYKTAPIANPTKLRTGSDQLWVPFTPVWNDGPANGSAGMSLSNNTGRFRLSNGAVDVQIATTVSFTGTPPAYLTVFLPGGYNTKSDVVLPGRDFTTGRGGLSAGCVAGVNYCSVVRYDNGQPAVSGTRLVLGGTYEVN